MNDSKYIGMDVHRESISIAVLNSAGKIVLECLLETKASIAGSGPLCGFSRA
jgi:hypothetical protein